MATKSRLTVLFTSCGINREGFLFMSNFGLNNNMIFCQKKKKIHMAPRYCPIRTKTKKI